MNAITPASAFDLTPDRFDTFVANTFAGNKASRHVRDRLIAQVDGGRLDHMLLRARSGLALSDAVNRKAALNIIDFAFEPLVLQGMSADQAVRYLGAVENTLRVHEARGLDGFGPLWVDTIHHVCVFSVLFQLAAFLGKNRRFSQVVLLHQGRRPEPRLRIVVDLLRRAHGVALVLLPLQGHWFPRLARLTTPSTVIFYLTDMPPEAFLTRRGDSAASRAFCLPMNRARRFQIETVSGSQSFARRLGATRIALDYPSTDSVRIRPAGADEAELSLCPLEDWLFWPLLGAARQQAIARDDFFAQVKEKSSGMQQEAQAFVDEWAQTFNTGRAADLARFYAPDARIVPPGRSTVVGAAAICAYFADIRAQGFHDYAVDLGDVFARDASLVASGRWALQRADGAAPQLYQGNWLNVFAHGRTGWLIVVHMWN